MTTCRIFVGVDSLDEGYKLVLSRYPIYNANDIRVCGTQHEDNHGTYAGDSTPTISSPSYAIGHNTVSSVHEAITPTFANRLTSI